VQGGIIVAHSKRLEQICALYRVYIYITIDISHWNLMCHSARRSYRRVSVWGMHLKINLACKTMCMLLKYCYEQPRSTLAIACRQIVPSIRHPNQSTQTHATPPVLPKNHVATMHISALLAPPLLLVLPPHNAITQVSTYLLGQPPPVSPEASIQVPYDAVVVMAGSNDYILVGAHASHCFVCFACILNAEHSAQALGTGKHSHGLGGGTPGLHFRAPGTPACMSE